MNIATTWLVAAAAASGLLVASCGDDLSAEDQALADAFVADEGFNEGFEAAEVSEECVAERTVQALGGADGAEQNYGITVDNIDGDGTDLSEADAEEVVDAIFSCSSSEDRFLAYVFSEGSEITPEGECMAEAIPNDLFKQLLVYQLSGNFEAASGLQAETDAAIEDAAASCGVDL